MVGGQKLDSAHCNFSHQDQIWRDYVKKERTTSMKRDKDYNFLVQEYRTLRKDIFELRARRQGLQPTPSSNSSAPKLTDDINKPENKEQTDHHSAAATRTTTDNDLKLPPLDVPHQDTSNPFPLVTSREIGWRAGRKYNLEVYGRWGKPKYSIINQLKWPNDAVP